MEEEGDWLIDASNGVFQSHYILGDIIGRGSISTVHSCLYKGRKKYACKIIPKSRIVKQEAQARIQTLLKLHHENIVTVREIYDDTRCLYVVEDLASGGELLERLAFRGEYSERDAAKAARDALAALEYIHGMGLCHGSVRPEKLLYASEHENSPLLLTTMGISKFSPNSYNILYCAPEVMNTSIICPAADIWSLGVVIYIMLCGFEPFRETRETLFPSPYWDDKTDEAKDLIIELMQECAEKRPTARDVLKNVWICGDVNAQHSMTDAAKHLREFNARRKFKIDIKNELKLSLTSTKAKLRQSISKRLDSKEIKNSIILHSPAVHDTSSQQNCFDEEHLILGSLSQVYYAISELFPETATQNQCADTN